MNAWVLAARPQTLPASMAPVLIGGAFAWRDHVFHAPSFLCALACALCIQIAVNLANDYFDGIKGTDEHRIGPLRITASGMVEPTTVWRAFLVVAGFAALIGTYLVWRGGLPILFIGLLSIFLCYAYTGGPFPLAYLGGAELFVLIFFGPVASAGTYFVQSQSWSGLAALSGLGSAFIAAALLTVNNLRDLEGDARANKRTLAVRLGDTFSRIEYVFCFMASSVIAFQVGYELDLNFLMLLSVLFAFLAAYQGRRFFYLRDAVAFNRQLATTGKLLLVYSITFSVALICPI
jgi:1,4-dihydroxy-2-naphthoate octaprenyltransferase